LGANSGSNLFHAPEPDTRIQPCGVTVQTSVSIVSVEEHEVYSALGEEGFELLIGAFYQQVKTDDVLGPLYPAHDFPGAEKRLRDFLIFRFGGPQHYIEQRGHPRLRMRHAPFPVDQAARDRWMQLMDRALATVTMPEEARSLLREYFESTATAMMNRI
jgi:hemoglobin